MPDESDRATSTRAHPLGHLVPRVADLHGRLRPRFEFDGAPADRLSSLANTLSRPGEPRAPEDPEHQPEPNRLDGVLEIAARAVGTEGGRAPSESRRRRGETSDHSRSGGVRVEPRGDGIASSEISQDTIAGQQRVSRDSGVRTGGRAFLGTTETAGGSSSGSWADGTTVSVQASRQSPPSVPTNDPTEGIGVNTQRAVTGHRGSTVATTTGARPTAAAEVENGADEVAASPGSLPSPERAHDGSHQAPAPGPGVGRFEPNVVPTESEVLSPAHGPVQGIVARAPPPTIAPTTVRPRPLHDVVPSLLGFSAQHRPGRFDAEVTGTPVPAVHVTIGRVEIRAVVAAGPPATAKHSSARPPMSLTDYLSRRNGGQG